MTKPKALNHKKLGAFVLPIIEKGSHTAATNMHQLTDDFYTVGEVLGYTLAGIGVSLGLSMNFEAVTARYVDVRLERKKEVLDAYHSAVEKAAPEKPKEAEPKKGKRAAKKKHSEIDL